MHREHPRTTHLVIVRSGEGSLHTNWLGDDSTREWELIESYYGPDPDKAGDVRFERIPDRGLKWDSLARLLRGRPELFDTYEYIWLPDDDLACGQEEINRLFRSTRRHGLLVSQPSLSGESHHSHPTLLQNESFEIRYTTFVEVMCPCFRSSYLRELIPLLELSPSGWGLDLLWGRLMQEPHQRCGVIDDVCVTHTRPMGTGSIWSDLERARRAPREDMERLLERFDGYSRIPRIDSGILRSGRHCRSRWLLAWLVRRGMRAHLARTPDPGSLREAAKRAFRQHRQAAEAATTLRYRDGQEIPGLELPIRVE